MKGTEEGEGCLAVIVGWLCENEIRQRECNGVLAVQAGRVEVRVYRDQSIISQKRGRSLTDLLPLSSSQEKRKARIAACLHFSAVKTRFLQNEMPILIELAKQLHKHHQESIDGTSFSYPAPLLI